MAYPTRGSPGWYMIFIMEFFVFFCVFAKGTGAKAQKVEKFTAAG
jgi:hypothetical protein